MSATPRYSLAEAQALLAEARQQAAAAARIIDELRLLQFELEGGVPDPDVLVRSNELELALDDAFRWFEAHGVQVKHLGPVLLDFPSRAIQDGVAIDVLLCWREDEQAIAYYHGPRDGYRGRTPVAMLDEV
ncbi:MAG: DUF2203 family protein [Nitriliruptoraceae bacterium]